MYKTYFLLIIFVLLFGCNKPKSELDVLLDELKTMSIDSESLDRLFLYQDEILETKNSRELTRIASDIYYRTGNPSFKRDRDWLYVAISFLDKALKDNPGNRIAFENKVRFLNLLGDFDESLNTINGWIMSQKSTYKDFMQKALIYYIVDQKDSAEVYFNKAEAQHKKTRFKKQNIEERAQLAIIKAFLDGKDAGLQEIQKLIEETAHPVAYDFKDFYLDDFDRDKYVDHHVLGKPLIETTTIFRGDSTIKIHNSDTVVTYE